MLLRWIVVCCCGWTCCACRERRLIVSIEGREGAKRKVQTKELEPMRCFFPLVAFLYRFRGEQIWCLLLFAFFFQYLVSIEDRYGSEREETEFANFEFFYICFVVLLHELSPSLCRRFVFFSGRETLDHFFIFQNKVV